MKNNNIHAAILLMAAAALTACGKSETPATPTAEAEKPAESEHHGEIKLSAEKIKAARIGLAQVGPASIHETLPLYGVIAPNAERVREVAARFPGVIRTIGKKVGDAVRQGESLASIGGN